VLGVNSLMAPILSWIKAFGELSTIAGWEFTRKRYGDVMGMYW
jgi:hypothetical protein